MGRWRSMRERLSLESADTDRFLQLGSQKRLFGKEIYKKRMVSTLAICYTGLAFQSITNEQFGKGWIRL